MKFSMDEVEFGADQVGSMGKGVIPAVMEIRTDVLCHNREGLFRIFPLVLKYCAPCLVELAGFVEVRFGASSGCHSRQLSCMGRFLCAPYDVYACVV